MTDAIAILEIQTPTGTERIELRDQSYCIGRKPAKHAHQGATLITIPHTTVSACHITLIRFSGNPPSYRCTHGPITERVRATNRVYVTKATGSECPSFDCDELLEGRSVVLQWGDNIRLSPSVMLRYRQPPTGELIQRLLEKEEETISQ